MEIFVTKNDMEQALNSLNVSNGEYLVIKDHLFSVDKILTILPSEKNEFECENVLKEDYSFSFSYDDGVFQDLIIIVYNYEDSSCLSYLLQSGLINANNIEEIYKKAYNSVFNSKQNSEDLKEEFKKVDNIVYNEALLYLSNGINKDDKEFTQDDFNSKFETYKKTIDNRNCDNSALLIKFQHKLINQKFVR